MAEGNVSGINMTRIALIGKTGVGKSALGNTIAGKKVFKSSIAGHSVTYECKSADSEILSNKKIRVVDTPGLMDTRGKDVRNEVTKAIAMLSPGPHAFIIVLQPGRLTNEEKNVIKELRGLFGDETFLDYTMIVMVRKNDLNDEEGDPIDIHTFIRKMAASEVQSLYEKCNKRIVAVENNTRNESEKTEYAREILEMVDSMGGGFYAHTYFQLLQQKKIQEREIKKLRKALEEQAKAEDRSFCNIL